VVSHAFFGVDITESGTKIDSKQLMVAPKNTLPTFETLAIVRFVILTHKDYL
jgi:hypothetical protein